MGKIWCKLWAKFDQFMCHILPMMFLHSKFLKDFNSHSHTRSDSSVRVREGRGISIHTPVQGVTRVFTQNQDICYATCFCFPTLCSNLAHKRAFFNRNFLYYNKKKQNQSCEQDCKKCVYAALTSVIL